MATSVSITPNILIGVVDLAFSISAPPSGASISRITTLTNEVGVGTSITETDHPIKDSSGATSTKVSLSSELAPAGKTLFAVLSIYFSNGDVVSSSPSILTPIGIPLAPSHSISFFTELDKGISMNLGSMYTRMGSSDGYSQITSAIVYISKVGGKLASDFRTINVAIDGAAPVVNGVPTGIDGYSKQYVVADDLVNGVDYEVAFRVKNNLGVSPISKTYNVRPKDFPAVLSPARVHTLLGEQTRTASALNDLRGDVLVYFSLPSDNEQLKATAPVQRYIVTETPESGTSTTYTLPVTQIATTGANPVAAGTPITTGLPSNIAFESASFAAEDSYNGVYNYKLTIFGSAARLGVKNTYTVVAENANGKGPDSPTDSQSSVIPFLLPSTQPFFVDHETVPGSTVNGGLAYVVHTGKMSLRITSLSATNSGSDVRIDRSGITGLDCQLKLQVATVAAPTTFIFNDAVTFKQGLNTVTSGVPAVTTNTPTGVYTLSLDDASVSGSTLNSLLVRGTKYIFTVIRLTKNPNTMNTTLESLPTSISRTNFSSPAKSNFCESYAFDENFNPVTTVTGKKAIQILFGRLTNEVLSACGLTSTITGTGAGSALKPAINYLAFQQSQPVFVDNNGDLSSAPDKKQLSVSHYPVSDSPYSLIVPAANYGAAMENYLRIQLYNSELDTYINASESFPAVNEAALNYVNAPSTIEVQKLTETSIKVIYSLQSGIALNGNSSSNVKNRVLVIDDSTNLVAHQSVINYSESPAVQVSGLTTSKIYRVHVIGETYYNRRNYNSGTTNETTGVFTPDNSSLRFENIVVRDPNSSVATSIIEMTGQPTAPTNIEFFASDKQVTAYWDAPTDVYGVKNLKYHFYSALKTLGSYATESTADISGTSSIVITRAATQTTQPRALMPEFVNGTVYRMAMAVVGTIGGVSAVNDTFTHTYNDGKIGAVAKPSVMSLITTQTAIPETPAQGVLSASFDVMPSTNVAAPAGVAVTSKSGMLQVTFNKNTQIGDVLISVNTNDGVNASNGPVLAFDSRFARSTSTVNSVTTVVTGGIWNIESAYNSLSESLKTLYNPYSFQKKTENGVDTYTVNFSGLKNAVLYTFELRHIISISGNDVFSEVVTSTGSPEAAPETVTNTAFTVDSGSITASFSPPLSKGSATARLIYSVSYLDTTNQASTTGQTITSDLNETADTRYSSTINGLVNGRAYKVYVTAYYIKADGSQVTGEATPINTSGTGNIKPNAAPVGPTMTATAGDNVLTAVVTPASQSERNLYGISALNLYVSLSSSPSTRTLVKTWAPSEYVSATGTLTQTINSFTSFTHSRPLNGVSYNLSLEPVSNYTDAQAIPSVDSSSIMPAGNVKISSTSINNRAITVSGILNGSGSITNIISLVKPTGSNNIVVKNLSGGDLPAISVFGSLDNAINYVGANQQFTVNLNYGTDIASAIEHHLSVIVTPNSSDTAVNNSTFFA